MVTVKSNINLLSKNILQKLEILNNREYLLRPVVFDVIALMKKRIHIDGQDSSDRQIGDYSASYLKIRKNQYKRREETKIIVSLTRQLENDWNLIATQRGYGAGFLNPFNLQKARWVEQGQDKRIFNLTQKEREYALNKLRELIRSAIDS